MAIAESVVVRKGGEMSFESTEGGVSRFYADIPERQTQGQQRAKKAP